MLDPKLVVADPERVRATLRRRHADEATLAHVDRIVALASERSAKVTDDNNRRALRNELSSAIGALMKQGKREEAEAQKVAVAENNAVLERLAAEIAAIETELRSAALSIPNLLADDVPDGHSADDNPVMKTWGTPKLMAGDSHVEIGERLGIVDLERGAKLAGTRFAVLHGWGARIERALMNFFLDLHGTEHGYAEVAVPYMVHARMMEGTGQLPKFGADMFKIEGKVNGEEAYLIPTAEVPVTNLHRDEILEGSALPKKYVCFTPCFRSEAGSAGRDVRGLIRVHQFHKVELVWTVRPEDSAEAHEQLVRHAEIALERLEIPYRRVLLCAGDIGFGAARCYDLEAWLPSQGTYREISSCSNFHDFQARRMELRYRPADVDGKKQKPALAHTLNGSGLPLGRTLVALLENHVEPDGGVYVPPALRPYLGVDRIPAPT